MFVQVIREELVEVRASIFALVNAMRPVWIRHHRELLVGTN